MFPLVGFVDTHWRRVLLLGYALPGPFVDDKAWGLPLQTQAVDGAGPAQELQFLGACRIWVGVPLICQWDL